MLILFNLLLLPPIDCSSPSSVSALLIVHKEINSVSPSSILRVKLNSKIPFSENSSWSWTSKYPVPFDSPHFEFGRLEIW